jgi:hypothetical protein
MNSAPTELLKVLVNRGVREGTVQAQVDDTACQAGDGAHEDIASASLGNAFPANGIFLVIEKQVDVGSAQELTLGSDAVVQLDRAREEDYVAETEGVWVCPGGAVFARAHEKEKGNDNQVCNSAQGLSRLGIRGNHCKGVANDKERNGENTCGRGVHLLVELELASQPQVQGASGV